MYAIVDIAGQQFKVEKEKRYFVNLLEGKTGDKVVFDNVLLLDNKGKISVGTPSVSGANVTVKIEQHLKGDKVIVFKKKRRKGYKVTNGHRQQFTEISIQDISTKAAKKTANISEKNKEEIKSKSDDLTKTTATPVKATAKKPATKKTTTTSPKATAKKPATKKTTATSPKATAKKPATKKTTTKAVDPKESADKNKK